MWGRGLGSKKKRREVLDVNKDDFIHDEPTVNAM